MNRVPSVTIGVTGANGFIGSHLIPELLGQPNIRLRALSRRAVGTAAPDLMHARTVRMIAGDLCDPPSLGPFLEGVDWLVNLAHPSGQSAERVGEHLVKSCQAAGVQRVVHVSTATVVGRTPEARIDESTPCRPSSAYEYGKWLVEQQLREGLADTIDFAILRPTAVFGPRSQNLLKLARTVTAASPWRRHLLRFVHGRRSMHLVPVEDVVCAIRHLLFAREKLGGETYIVACDTHPDNQYQAIDAVLGAALGKPLPPRSPALPVGFLKLALQLMGRSQSDPQLRFDGRKLETLGVTPGDDFGAALARFAAWYTTHEGRAP